MNVVYDLDKFENIESLLELMEKDRIISLNGKSAISKIPEELFFLKENGSPSEIQAKWDELRKTLESFKP